MVQVICKQYFKSLNRAKFTLVFFSFLLPNLLSAQVDTVDYARLDSMSGEQLQEYYLSLPEPPDYYRGPSVGDSLFSELRKLAAPDGTVQAPSLSFREDPQIASSETDTPDMAMQKNQPKISLGMGRLGFHGDLYKKKFQLPLHGRMGYELGISQRLTRYLQIDFNVLFGKLAASEWLDSRQENFQSEVRAGGVNLLYDFGNFIGDEYRVRPFVSAGISGFEFLSKTDLKDAHGNRYHYWSDGSIKNMQEGAPGAQNAEELVRDYEYESDIRELNRDGFGRYAERAWAAPVGIGAVMKVSDRFDIRFGFQYWLTTTDYIDGIAQGGTGARKGTKNRDNFTYTSVSLQYDLITIRRPAPQDLPDTLKQGKWLAIEIADSDNDGVRDFDDRCEGTPEDVSVDENGCPIDDDLDGIPTFRDDELATAPGAAVDGRGVTKPDSYWQDWYDRYNSDGENGAVATEVVGSIFNTTAAGKEKKFSKDDSKIYTVELVRYSGSIPSDELAFLLSIGDITSTTLDDGTTVVYTSGNYEKLSAALKRRDEFRAQGNKGAGISTLEGNNIVQLREDELEYLLEKELSQLINVDIGAMPEEESFESTDVVFRVQLGAFKNKISTNVFNTSAGVLELKTGQNVYRYVTKGYRTIEDAAAVRADLVVQGYSDAFVTAYRGGKRIPLSETKATVEKDFEEDMSEDKMFSSVDKSLIAFKVQLGPLKRTSMEQSMDARTEHLASLEKQTTATGSIRYTTGKFTRLDDAEKYRQELEENGFFDAFVIATFRDEVVSIQEALELLK